jgi:predicted lipoprotein
MNCSKRSAWYRRETNEVLHKEERRHIRDEVDHVAAQMHENLRTLQADLHAILNAFQLVTISPSSCVSVGM